MGPLGLIPKTVRDFYHKAGCSLFSFHLFLILSLPPPPPGFFLGLFQLAYGMLELAYGS